MRETAKLTTIFFLIFFSSFILVSSSIASADITKWNSVTRNASDIFSVNITIDESKEVEFGVSSNLSYGWTWFVNGDEKKETEGKSSNLSYVFEEYGLYNISIVGKKGNETKHTSWNVTVSLIIKEGNDIRELEGLGNYTLSISEKPERVVSIAPSCTEILFAVGAGDSVVGVTRYCDYPPEVEEKKKEGEITVIGGYSTPSFEKIVNLDPDLIVAAHGNPSDVIYQLVELGYPVYAQHPKNIEEVFSHIKITGEITSCDTGELLDGLEGEMEEMKERTSFLEENQRPRTFYTMGDYWTGGEGTFINDIIEKAGGENIAAKYFSGWHAIGLENLVKENPQVIICSKGHGGMSPAYEQIMSEDALKDVDAVENDRVYLIDEDIISRPGPRVVNATKIIHGYLYGLFNIPKECTTIKGAYFGVPFVTLEISAKDRLALRLNISEVEKPKEAKELGVGRYIRINASKAENLSKSVLNIKYGEGEIKGLEEDSIEICFWNETSKNWESLKTYVDEKENIASANLPSLRKGIYGLTASPITSPPAMGGGGEHFEKPEKEEKNVTTIVKGEEKTIEIRGECLINITIKAREDVKFENISVISGDLNISQPPGIVYTYLNVTTENLTGIIDWLKLNFSVNKSWVIANNNSVSLFYYSNQTWKKLNTSEIGETKDSIHYSAIGSGFGVFAICAEKSVRPLKPPKKHAKFEFIELNITKKVRKDEKAGVLVRIKNVGDISGDKEIKAKINGEETASERIELKPNETKTLFFPLLTSKEGEYTVSIDGKNLSYEVTSPEASGFEAILVAICLLLVFFLRRIK